MKSDNQLTWSHNTISRTLPKKLPSYIDIGDPKATAFKSVDELKKAGMCGIYTNGPAQLRDVNIL